MDQLHSLRIFARVAETGSFSATAREMAMGQAAVSKHIALLEERLKASLLTRTTRQLHMTEAGELFYRQAKSILEQYDFAVSQAKNLEKNPNGTIRIATPIVFGRMYMTPLFPEFHQRYPEIVIEHFLNDARVDLVRDGIDLAVRIGDMQDSSYQTRRLGSTRRVTVASKEFVKKHGKPKHPRDLQDMPCIINLGNSNPFEWQYMGKDSHPILVPVKGNYRTDVSEAVREAVLGGMGVYYAPSWLFGEDIKSGDLVRLLPEYDSQELPISAVSPSSSYIPQKTRAMIDFLIDAFKANPLLRA